MKAIGFRQSLPITDDKSFIEFEAERPSPTGYDLLIKISAISVNPVELEMPEEINMVWIDGPTGLLSAKHCENAVELPYIRGSEPQEYAGCEARSPLDWLKKLFK